MKDQEPSAAVTPDQTLPARAGIGWSLWALMVLALAAVGALSYRLSAEAPLATFTLPPVAMIVFGLLAGAVQALALRRHVPPARWWVVASSLAGFVAACVCLLPTALAATPPGLLAGWAYGWAAYGAVLGAMLQRIFPSRRLMLASVVGWATAGIASGALGWALNVLLVTDTDPSLSPLPAISRTWSMAGLALLGAVCGATGGALSGAALALLSPVPVSRRDSGAKRPKDTKLVNVAGVVCGLVAAVLCTYLAPLLLTQLTEGSLDSLDPTLYPLTALYATPICIPTIAVVSIPLGIGCAHVGLEIGRTIGRPGPRFWVWCGAALGGVAGYVLGSLVAFAAGHLRG